MTVVPSSLGSGNPIGTQQHSRTSQKATHLYLSPELIPQDMFWTVPQIMPQPLASTPFPIHNSLTITQYDAVIRASDKYY
jgi:hypothetical protein